MRTLTDLRREFAGGCENQRARPPSLLIARQLSESLQEGQHEAGCLACAGLGASENIVAFEDKWNGLLLNWGCLLVTEFVDRTKQFGRKAEFIE